MDPVTKVSTGQSFTLKYHYCEDIFDILVLRQNFVLARQRDWQPGDRFRSTIGDSWWEGRLGSLKAFNDKRPKSMYLYCSIT